MSEGEKNPRTREQDSNLNGSNSSSAEGAENGASAIPRENQKRRRENGESQSETETEVVVEGEFLKSVLEMQIVTMETHLNSIQLLAQNIPSNKKLPLALNKIRDALAEYKCTRNSDAEPENLESAPSAVLTPRKKARLILEPQINIEQGEGQEKIWLDRARALALTRSRILGLIEQYLKNDLVGPEIPSEIFHIAALWNEQAREKFFKNEYLQIPSDFHSVLKKVEDDKVILLYELKKWFPEFRTISKLIIRSKSDFNLFTDLQILGAQIHTIKFNLETFEPLDSEEYAEMLELVFKKCPNLTFLDTEEKREEEEKTRDDKDKKSSFGSALMMSCSRAPGQLTISELYVELLPYIWNEFESPRSSESYYRFLNYDSFAETGVRLINFTLVHGPFDPEWITLPLVAEATSKILHASKTTLQKFRYDSKLCGNVLNEVEAPLIMNLQTLDITTSIDSDTKSIYFKPGFRFSTQLPNLKTVHLNLHVHPGCTSFCESIKRAPSVKTLRFHDYGGHDSQLEIFQQVEELSFSWPHGKSSAIWKCKKLKKLVIFNVYSAARESLIRLTAQLTGVKEEEVEELWNWTYKSLTVAEDSDGKVMMNMDVKPSIAIAPSGGFAELQDLETLIVKAEPFLDDPWEPKEDIFPSVLRALTCEFMPKLKRIRLEEERYDFVSKMAKRNIYIGSEKGLY